MKLPKKYKKKIHNELLEDYHKEYLKEIQYAFPPKILK